MCKHVCFYHDGITRTKRIPLGLAYPHLTRTPLLCRCASSVDRLNSYRVFGPDKVVYKFAHDNVREACIGAYGDRNARHMCGVAYH